VQKLFSNNKGTNLLAATSNNSPLTGQDGLFASAVLDKNTNEVILKLVNTSANAQTKEINLEGVKKLAPKASVMVLKSDDPNKVNSLDDPKAVSPVQQEVNVSGGKISLSAAPYSLTVMRVKIM
jgi:alpha-L-arabinofuranosidase